MRILLTGSSGWLGRFLAPRLRRGRPRSHRPRRRARRRHRRHRLRRRPRPRRPHLRRAAASRPSSMPAPCTSPTSSATRSQAFVDVNVTGTLNLLEAAVGGGQRPLRLHLDHLADDLRGDPRRQGRRGPGAAWLTEDYRPARAAQHLRRHQARRRAALPARPPRARPRHLVLRTGRFFPEEDDTHRDLTRPEHQGQRVPQPPAHRRGCRRSPCRGAGAGAEDRLRHLHRLRAAAFLAGRSAEALIARRRRRSSSAISRTRRTSTPAPAGRCRSISTGSTIRRRAERVLGFRCRTDFAAVLDALAGGRPLPFAHDPNYVSPKEGANG